MMTNCAALSSTFTSLRIWDISKIWIALQVHKKKIKDFSRSTFSCIFKNLFGLAKQAVMILITYPRNWRNKTKQTNKQMMAINKIHC